MVQNKGLFYLDHPTGLPEEGKHLKVQSQEFDVDQAPPQGGITAKVNYASFDPYQRGRMRAPTLKSYAPPFKVGEPIVNAIIVTVLKSENSSFPVGSIVRLEQGPFLEFISLSGEALKQTGARVVQNPFKLDFKLFLGALGMPGLTAYSSFYDIGKPKKGETIFISAASGAVGQLVGQLAKHEGLTVIGSVGDDAKLDFITKTLRFDHGFNYKKEKPEAALARLAPNGIDIYYENVGGEHLEAALNHLNTFGRVVACGMISQYNLPAEQHYGVRNLMLVVAKRLTIRGFIVLDESMGSVYSEEHQKNVQKWIADGSFHAEMSVTKGMDHAAEGLLSLFSGKNFGKAILEVSPIA